jgi:hypothetical protein
MQKQSDRSSGTTTSRQPKSARQTRDKKSGTVTVSLRVPIPMLNEIDAAVRSRPYKIPRHMWLLEAIHEKLARIRESPTQDTGR